MLGLQPWENSDSCIIISTSPWTENPPLIIFFMLSASQSSYSSNSHRMNSPFPSRIFLLHHSAAKSLSCSRNTEVINEHPGSSWDQSVLCSGDRDRGRNTNGRQRSRPGLWVNVSKRKLQLRSLLLLCLLLMLSFIYEEWSKNAAIWHSVAIYTFILNTYSMSTLLMWPCCALHTWSSFCAVSGIFLPFHVYCTILSQFRMVYNYYNYFFLFSIILSILWNPLAPLSYTPFCFGLSSLLPIASFLPFTALHHFFFFTFWLGFCLCCPLSSAITIIFYSFVKVPDFISVWCKMCQKSTVFIYRGQSKLSLLYLLRHKYWRGELNYQRLPHEQQFTERRKKFFTFQFWDSD